MKITTEAREFLASIGKRGGSSKSERKAKACRKNGKLGGRPKKEKEPILFIRSKPKPKLDAAMAKE